jgi:ectoine hydroxylase-related dioxygenase (phytanoyl-CoA dioxygenase family)
MLHLTPLLRTPNCQPQVYFVRDNDAANGAFCVVPGSHKANLPVPQEYLPRPNTTHG